MSDSCINFNVAFPLNYLATPSSRGLLPVAEQAGCILPVTEQAG